MDSFRSFMRTNRRLAVLVLALALAMKVLVPAGYMLAQEATVLTVTICADGQGKRIIHEIPVPKKAGHHEDAGDQGKSSTCSWSSFATGALGGIAPELLAAAIAFILALCFRPVVPLLGRPLCRLRPPLRAPPALA